MFQFLLEFFKIEIIINVVQITSNFLSHNSFNINIVSFPLKIVNEANVLNKKKSVQQFFIKFLFF